MHKTNIIINKPFGSRFLKGFFYSLIVEKASRFAHILIASHDNNATMAIILFSGFDIAVSNHATCDANLDFLISCFAFTL